MSLTYRETSPLLWEGPKRLFSTRILELSDLQSCVLPECRPLSHLWLRMPSKRGRSVIAGKEGAPAVIQLSHLMSTKCCIRVE